METRRGTFAGGAQKVRARGFFAEEDRIHKEDGRVVCWQIASGKAPTGKKKVVNRKARKRVTGDWSRGL